MDPLIIAFGLGVGILVGMTGVGGGSLMTPILIIVFGYKPVTAIGTDLAYGAVTKTVGGWRHWRHKTVDFDISKWMAFGSVPAAILGVWALHLAENAWGKSFDKTLLTVVSGALLITGVAVISRVLFLPKLIERERETVHLETRHKVAAVVLGVFVGFVLGVTSAGSGSLIAVGLILIFRLVPRRVVGTDVFHAAILLWAAALAHLVSGNIDFGLAGTILIGSIPGVVLGTRLSVNMPVGALRIALGVVLLASCLGLLSKAGYDIPAYAIIGGPLLVGAFTWATTARRNRKSNAVRADRPITAVERPA